MVKMRFTVMLMLMLGLACIRHAEARQDMDPPSVDTVLDWIGVPRGICVVLGDPKCELAINLARVSELRIYVQLPRDGDVALARQAVDEAGYYGTRIYVEQGPLTQLHLADDLADVLIAVDEAASMDQAEALRVLRPMGKALLGRKELTKAFPEGVDDWSHPYHGPDNNVQSQDLVARAPYLTQFLAEPRWAPLPQVAVASAGRVFKSFGDTAIHEREELFLNTLAAFNGYNGTLLWKRLMPRGLMVMRNTLIATPETLYVGDDKSCKLLDPATGRIKDEIIPPREITGGTFWKWMGMEDGVLYALVGEQEQRDRVAAWRTGNHGWGGPHLGQGFSQPKHPWGFGKNLLAIDPQTKKILWHHRETEPIDSRALCMKDGRIYIFRLQSYLACLDAKTGREIWRKTPTTGPELFAAIGENNWTGWNGWTAVRPAAYLRCSDKVLYFAGPPFSKLLAVSAADGSVMWEDPTYNYYLILREDGLYGIGGEMNKFGDYLSVRLDPLTGQVLEKLPLGRLACARATGTVDSIFVRGLVGTTRFDLATHKRRWVSTMRPQCHDGVTVTNGLLYWWPSVCDCEISITGVTALGPAGNFEFNPDVNNADRLETTAADLTGVESLPISPADWPTYRADNTCSATSSAIAPETVQSKWGFQPETPFTPSTAPVTAGGLVFFGSADGIVRALDAASGQLRWKAYTGGAVQYPPTIWQDRVFVGSGDGWVYSLEAATGRLLWRFRVAPAERKIPVYDSLISTWPAASGVRVEAGVAYVGAGLFNYDGTHVYALDAITGQLKWHNGTSGHLDPEARTGVSVQGHLLLNEGKLYMAGGTLVSPAVYDTTNGNFLNDPAGVQEVDPWRTVYENPRGSELYLVGDAVHTSGKPLYSDLKYPVNDYTVRNRSFFAASQDRIITWVKNKHVHGGVPNAIPPVDRLMCFTRERESEAVSFLTDWKRIFLSSRGLWEKPTKITDGPAPQTLWEYSGSETVALALCPNALVVADHKEIYALSLEDGRLLWVTVTASHPIPWGLAVDRDGRVLATLEDGSIMCLGPAG